MYCSATRTRVFTAALLLKGLQTLILGIGTDLTEIDRIQRAVARFGDRFLQRVFTAGELQYCRGKRRGSTESLAARFSAKEAGSKALGTGMAGGMSWLDMEVAHLPGGRPTLLLHGRAADRAKAMGVTGVHLTLSHSRVAAIAIVVLEGQ